MATGSRPAIVGILNTTPDSFSDGGRHAAPAVAIAAGLAMAAEGADWIDVGGESTRPGAPTVSATEELARTEPVVRALAEAGLAVSVDTRKAEVAARALAAGARMVNDVSGGLHDPEILAVTARAGAYFVAMHLRGTPTDMQQHATYRDVVREVREELAERLDAARAAGIATEHLIADPGFGFAKRLEHNVELLARLDELGSLGVPLFVGISRKSMIGALTGEDEPTARLAGSLAALTAATLHGASYLRVHDVAPSLAAAKVASRLRA
jgi:dihydropteroate synthase